MNERIEELKKQAWEYTMAVHDGLVVPPPEKPVWPVDEVYEEKFAELIVKECANIVQDSPWQLPQGYKSVDQAKLVKKYFGVD